MSKSVNKKVLLQAQHEATAARLTQSARADPGRPKEIDPASKRSRVITMLQSPAGATIASIGKVTGWQLHSVRGFLAGIVRKRLKLRLGSKKVDGTRVYQIAGTAAGKRSKAKARSI